MGRNGVDHRASWPRALVGSIRGGREDLPILPSRIAVESGLEYTEATYSKYLLSLEVELQPPGIQVLVQKTLGGTALFPAPIRCRLAN